MATSSSVQSVIGESGFGTAQYHAKPSNFLLSFLLHVVCVLLIWQIAGSVLPTIRRPDPIPLVSTSKITFSGTGGGSGGNHSLLPASRGALPEMSPEEQIVPPSVTLPNQEPELAVKPSLLMAIDAVPPQHGQLGDPDSNAQIPSDGPGRGGGIGNDCCGGIGHGKGPGYGDGHDGLYPAGRNGVTIPRVLYDPEPPYSDAARAAKTQGTVTLQLVVGADGKPRDIHVQKGLGMGLDERAIATVLTWRFEPATLHGSPVAVAINVEVNFRLF
jgi:periplasmic protein TonB